MAFNGNTTFGTQAATTGTAAPLSKWIFSGSSQSLTESAPSTNFSFTNVEVGTSSIATNLSIPNSSFNVSGNWNNYGTITHSAGTVTFNGASAQTIDGGAASSLNNVTINNANGINLTQNLSVAGYFDFYIWKNFYWKFKSNHSKWRINFRC